MGIYINKGNEDFQRILNSEYVDKTGLIAIVNATLFTEQCFSCVTRCRRFGKTLAAKMLCAYYDHSCDSRSLFADLQIASDPSFEKHLNKYPVIYLDMTRFTTQASDVGIVKEIEKRLTAEIVETYPDIPHKEDDDMMDFLLRVADRTGERFVFIIDEWDAICRIYTPHTRGMDEYVNWLRRMFKDVTAMKAFAGVYNYAHGDYIFQREFATGKGFADLVLLPRKNVDTPAIIIELKCRRKPSGSAFSPADEAIAQIKERHYWEKVSAYMQDHTSACKAEASLLLVGIGYDKEKKMHDCRIEYKKL